MFSQAHPTRHAQAAGFTMVELVVVIGLISILTAFALPSWRAMIVSNEVRSASNELVNSFNFARSEAIRQSAPMTVCASTDGANCITASTVGFEQGWIVFSGRRTDSNPTIIQDVAAKPSLNFQMNPNTALSAITFLSNGLPTANFAGGNIIIQPINMSSMSETNTYSRYLCIARTGRVRILRYDDWLNLVGSTTCAAGFN